ncbi:hypothetical protein IE990_18645 [Klebsiella pneumoniae]|uniref:Uncharacterized protein n=1 Tax=Klebsiella pneumoniae TaxID=573 RepID=A0A927HKB0_KLEPN|nr:hypothetical protein [Klebsiella pneumoniae]
MKANFPALWLLALHNNHSLRRPAPSIQKNTCAGLRSTTGSFAADDVFPSPGPSICVIPAFSCPWLTVALFLLTQAMRYKRWPFSLSICPAFEYRAFFSGDAVTGKRTISSVL